MTRKHGLACRFGRTKVHQCAPMRTKAVAHGAPDRATAGMGHGNGPR